VAGWLPFTAVAAGITALLLVFARQSQELFDPPEESTADHPGSESVSAPEDGGRGDARAGQRQEQSDGGVDGSAAGSGARRAQPRSDHEEFDTASNTEGDSSGPTAPAGGPRPTAHGSELTPAVLLANVGATQGLVAVLLVAAGLYYDIPAAAFGITPDPWSTGAPAVAVGVGFGLALWVGNELATTVADAAGAGYDESVRELLAPETGEGWLVLFGLVLPIIAVAEELLFRAALIGVPAAGFDLSPWLFAVLASVAFALGHGAQGRVGIVVTGLLGLVLAAGYVLSGSLLLVVVAHYVVNATEFAVYEYAGMDGLFAASE